MKKRTGKMISLSLAVAMAMTAAPVTALAVDEPVLTTAQNAGETGTDTTTVDTKEEVSLTKLEPATVVAAPVVDEAATLDDATTREVSNQDELEAAIADAKDGKITTIKLGNDIFLTNRNKSIPENNAVITLPEGVILDGDNNSIIASDDWDNTVKNHLVGILDSSAEIRNITITGNDKTRHGINAYGKNNNATLTLNSVAITNCGTAGIVVNGAKVVADKITTSGNKWGAINVGDQAGSKLTLTNGSFDETQKIWSEYPSNEASTNITVDGLDTVAGVMINKDGDEVPFTYYTNDALELAEFLQAEAYNETSKTIYASFASAIEKATSGDKISLTNDVELDGSTTPNNSGAITIRNKQLTIDGQNHTLSAKEGFNTKASMINVEDDANVTFKDLTIDGKSLAKHGINIYSSTKATTQATAILDGDAGVTITGCTQYAVVNNASILTIHNITAYGNKYGINIDNATSAGTKGASFTMTGGTVTSDGYSGLFANSINIENSNNQPITAQISGGTFEKPVYVSNENTRFEIVGSDAKFKYDMHKYTDASHKVELKDTDGYYQYFSSVEDAQEHASAGDVIKDYTEGDTPNEQVQCLVTFNFDGGKTADGKTSESFVVTEGESIAKDAVPSIEKDRYTFRGWTVGGQFISFPYTVTETNVEITAQWTKKSSGGSHKFDNYITVITPKNGEVSVSDDWAYEDDKITLTITPDDGYEVDKIEIVDDEGDKIDAKKVDDEDNKYTFRMANCDVTVTVTFKEEGKTTEDTDKEEDKDDEETTELNFTDVKESDWFYKGVAYVVDKGVMSGVSENQFDPSGKLTRAMLVQMLYNMESRPACDAENAFIDVPVGQWYTDAVIWANDAKIVSGMGDGLFAPNMEITREQMVVMLYNYAKYKGYDVTASADLSKFADNASVSTWAQPAMQWAVAEGYISGMGDNQLAPHGTATRAEIASVIMRFMEATAESAETAE